MRYTDTLVIGGGQAGLAMSRCLADHGVDHVVLERGRLVERWRSERWDSLRLLTPSWMSRLPGWSYRGSDPHGYMSMLEVVDYLEGYARSFAPPVETGTAVEAVQATPVGYRVTTEHDTWLVPNVVLATGACDVPHIPEMAGALGGDVQHLAPSRYRNPEQLPAAEGVLVVGASASGIQLADEIHASGRPVTLAVGEHTRMPRLYRGCDILWWLDAMGYLGETADELPDLGAARREPSPQLVGRPDRTNLDLAVLEVRGVRLVGRAIGAERTKVHFADDLGRTTATAAANLERLLARIERFVAERDLASELGAPEPLRPVRPAPAPTALDLHAEGIRTVLWATGYRRDYSWLEVPVLDERGEILHRGGVTPSSGLYVLGLELLRTRKSISIDGVGDDARELARHIARRLAHPRTAVA